MTLPVWLVLWRWKYRWVPVSELVACAFWPVQNHCIDIMPLQDKEYKCNITKIFIEEIVMSRVCTSTDQERREGGKNVCAARPPGSGMNLLCARQESVAAHYSLCFDK